MVSLFYLAGLLSESFDLGKQMKIPKSFLLLQFYVVNTLSIVKR